MFLVKHSWRRNCLSVFLFARSFLEIIIYVQLNYYNNVQVYNLNILSFKNGIMIIEYEIKLNILGPIAYCYLLFIQLM